MTRTVNKRIVGHQAIGLSSDVAWALFTCSGAVSCGRAGLAQPRDAIRRKRVEGQSVQKRMPKVVRRKNKTRTFLARELGEGPKRFT
jgi:hypothetical protein